MILRQQLDDPYWKILPPDQLMAVEDLFKEWGLTQGAFLERFNRWFGQFPAADKKLAHKLLINLDYFSPTRFETRLSELHRQVVLDLRLRGVKDAQLIIVTPEGSGDSAHRHAYDVGKIWGVPRDRILSLHELTALNLNDAVIIFFNDTHGSGKQFMRDVWPQAERFTHEALHTYIAAVTVATDALTLFQVELPGVSVLPTIPAPAAAILFTKEEYDRFHQLGEHIYPKHPLGYGGTALLTVYYFQCPNNTLPIIWADGINNTVDGVAFPWQPLFPYRAKQNIGRSSIGETFAINSRPDFPSVPNLPEASKVMRNNNGLSSFPLPNVERQEKRQNEGTPIPRLFLHYFDHYFLEMKNIRTRSSYVLRECRLATRLALLAATEVIVPAAVYAESPLCKQIINEFRGLFSFGCIWQTGLGTNQAEYRARKLDEYTHGNRHYESYRRSTDVGAPPFLPRNSSSTQRLITKWNRSTQTNLPDQLAALSPNTLHPHFERQWERVADDLGCSAFIVEHVVPLLFRHEPTQTQVNFLHSFINRTYYEGFLEEFGAGVMTDLVFLRAPFPIQCKVASLSYQKLLQQLHAVGLDKAIADIPIHLLFSIRNDPKWISALRHAVVPMKIDSVHLQ